MPRERDREPMSPDVVEQAQRLDGTVDPSTDLDDLDDLEDEPLTPDVLEQRRVVEDDPDEEWRDD